jgi:ATP-binding cassette, subfamily B, bacterial
MSTPHTASVRRLVHTFGPNLWAERRALAASYMFRVLEVAIGVLAPWPLKLLIDYVLVGRPLPPPLDAFGERVAREHTIVALAAAIVILTALRAGADALQKITGARIRERLNLALRDRMLAHVQTLPPTLRTAHRSGELVLRLVGDVDLFARLQTKILPTMFESASTIVLILIVMWWIDWRVALLSLALLPAFAALARHYGRRLGAASREKRRHEGDVAGLAQEIVRNLPVIQALGGEKHARERFAHLNTRSLRAGVHETSVSIGLEQALKIAHGLAVAAVVGFGASLVLRDALTIGDLTVLAAYIVQLLKPVERLNDLAETTSRGLAAGERLLALSELQPAVQDAADAVAIGRARGVIEMRNVWFRYPPPDDERGDVLRGVSLRLEPGRLAVLIGATGAGKSSLLALLHRLFDPTSGVILLDGRPLPEISLQSLRAQIGSVAQDIHLFAGTIRQALTPTGATVTEDRFWEALRLVTLDDFIAGLPQRLDTRIGEDGVNLSGGQRQRLALARAFLLDRPILLLDEPISNVDPRSAAIIMDALVKLKRGRTCLAVTHRLSLLAHADFIYRLEGGTIIDITAAARESHHAGELA